MKQRLLITGGSGFIGRNLIELLSHKYNIAYPPHRELDLTDSIKVNRYFQSHAIDVVIHCANIGGTKKTIGLPNVVETNLKMFINVLRCKKFFKKMIYFGSGAEYDKSRDLKKVKETDFGKYIPEDSYGFYKYVCTKLIEKEVNIINLRLFGVFGKYEDFEDRFISYAICRTLLHKPIIIQKNDTFDYVCVEDVVKIVDYFIQNEAKYPCYNVGRGFSQDMESIALRIVKLISKTVPIRIVIKNIHKEYS